jgi:DNA polymerase-1
MTIKTRNNPTPPPETLNDLIDEMDYFSLTRGQVQPKFAECNGCPFYSHPRTREQEILGKGVDILIVGDKPAEEDIPYPPKSADKPDTGWEFKGRRWYGLKKFIKRNYIHNNQLIKFGLTSAVMCFEKKKKTSDYPVNVIRQCGNILRRKVFLSKAKVVVLMGRAACKGSSVPTLQKITSINKVRGKIYRHNVGDRDVYFIPTHSVGDVNKFPNLWSTVLIDLEKSIEIFKEGFEAPDILDISKDYVYPSSYKEIKAILGPLTEQPNMLVAFDIETTGLDSRSVSADIIAVSFAWGPGKSCAIDTRNLPEKSLKLIKDFLTSSTKKTAHNGQFDIEYIYEKWGIKVNNLAFDTMLNEYILDENRGGGDERMLAGEYTLKKLAWDYLPEYGGYEEDSGVIDKIKAGKILEIPTDDLLRYAAGDTDVTFQLNAKQLRRIFGLSTSSTVEELRLRMADKSRIHDKQLYHLCSKFMPRATYSVAFIKNAGMYIDTAYLKQLKTEVPIKMKVITDYIEKRCGREIALTKTADIIWLLHTFLGIPKPTDKKFLTDKGQPKTSKEVLEVYQQNHPDDIIIGILGYKKLKKLEGSFLKKIEQFISPKTGRVHPTYFLGVTKTGRLSCRDPNIQQMPKEVELPGGELISLKKLFIAPPGKVFLYADYSQMEFALLAGLSAGYGDDTLKQAVNEGLDLHCYVASKVFKKPYEEILLKSKDKDHPEHYQFAKLRSRAKAVGFGIIYGSSAWGMAKKQGISEKEAQGLIDSFFREFPGIQKYIMDKHRQVKDEHFSVSPFGRRRRFPVIDVRGWADNSCKRKAQNHPIQSGASDITLNAVIGLAEEMPKLGGQVIGTIHDSIISEIEDTPESIKKAAELYMEITVNRPLREYGFLNGVNLKVDLEKGYNWGDLESLEI